MPAALVVLAVALTAWLINSRADAAGGTVAGWGAAQLRVAEAWRVNRGEGVRIGFVDSGVVPSASGLEGRVAAMADCVGSAGDLHGCTSGSAPDVLGHGTAVAQIASAVAPASTLVVARAVGPIGAGYDDDVGAAIDWVVDHGAQVVNVSLAEMDGKGVYLGPRFAAAVERAWSQGAIPVLAAGNTGGLSPYGDLDALVAAATTQTGAVASYSDRTTTAKWGVAAPGGATMSVGGVVHLGTSVAAPNVSGAVALLLAAHHAPGDAVQRLLSTAVPCAGCGHGRIDVAAALGVSTATTAVPAAPPVAARPAPVRAAPPPVSSPPPPAPDLVIPDPSLLDRAPSL